MVTGTASDEDQTTASLDLGDIILNSTYEQTVVTLNKSFILLKYCELKLTQSDFEVVIVDTSSHGVDNRVWLLEDLLLHEVLVVSLHDLLDLQEKLVDLTGLWLIDVSVALDAMDAQVSVLDDGNIVIFQEDNLVGVLDDGAGIGGKEVLDVLVGAQWMEFGFDGGGGTVADWHW